MIRSETDVNPPHSRISIHASSVRSVAQQPALRTDKFFVKYLSHRLTDLTLLASENGLASVRFGRLDLGVSRTGSDILASAADQLSRYLDGEQLRWSVPTDLEGTTDFQRVVWSMLQEIPYGETRSYGWLASQLGNPNKARAVGQALGSNPIPIVIPCHRVTAADGSLGGFSAGLSNKSLLLNLESAQRKGMRG